MTEEMKAIKALTKVVESQQTLLETQQKCIKAIAQKIGVKV